MSFYIGKDVNRLYSKPKDDTKYTDTDRKKVEVLVDNLMRQSKLSTSMEKNDSDIEPESDTDITPRKKPFVPKSPAKISSEKAPVKNSPEKPFVPKLLGQGTYGKVMSTPNKGIVAKMAVFNKNFIQGPALVEYGILSLLRGERNVLRLDDIKFSPDSMDLYVEEYKTSLDKILGTDNLKDMDMRMKLMRQISEGLYNIHKYGICHRDLKPGNILVNIGDEKDEMKVAIADFGASEVTCGIPSLPGYVITTYPWACPENIYMKPMKNSGDVWSLGIIFIQILTNNKDTPYQYVEVKGGKRRFIESENVSNIDSKYLTFPIEKDLPQMIQLYTQENIRRILRNVNKKFVDLVCRMLDRDPVNRPTMKNVIMVLSGEKLPELTNTLYYNNICKKLPNYVTLDVIPELNLLYDRSEVKNYMMYTGKKVDRESLYTIADSIRQDDDSGIPDIMFDSLKKAVILLERCIIAPTPQMLYKSLTDRDVDFKDVIIVGKEIRAKNTREIVEELMARDERKRLEERKRWIQRLQK